MPTVHLTEKLVRDATAPKTVARPPELRDTEVKGLMVRVRHSGRKTFELVTERGGKRDSRVIGVHPQITVKAARDAANKILGEAIKRGHFPERANAHHTVAAAADDYMAWFRQNRKSIKETENAIDAHIRPTLGNRQLATLRAPDLRKWLENIAEKPARLRGGKQTVQRKHKAAPTTEDERRARRATANRILNVLKAILNRAFQEGLVTDNAEWRRVLPFKNVDTARIRFLSDTEGVRLVNACPADLRSLVRAALLTGARFGELAGLTARDVDLRAGRIYISESKSGRPRHIPLNPEGVEMFRDALVGKTGEQLLFTKADGTLWGKNLHVRPFREACKVAKIVPPISFHELRHTYASHLAQAGVDLLTISKLLGHADTRITSKHYAHLLDKTLAAAVTKLPSFAATQPAMVVEVNHRRIA
jgi:integrase